MPEVFEEKREKKEFNGLYRMKPGSETKILGLLGFAARARKLIFGSDLCRDSIRRGTAILTLVAADASDNTKKRILDACKYYDAELAVTTFSSDELSRRLGKTGAAAVVSVTDVNFADGIIKQLLPADTKERD